MAKSNPQEAILLRVAPDVAARLTKHAKASGLSRNQLIAEILDGWLADDYGSAECARVAQAASRAAASAARKAAREAVVAAMGGDQ